MAEAPAPPAPALLLVDKPAGPTSHDIVAAARRRLPRGTKVGHSGTLDPFATGLLVLMVGRATRLAPFLTGLDKTYLATVRTGFTSRSGDTEGPIEPAGPPASAEEVAAVLPGFVGRVRQRVPALSAVKVEGERLYAKVRRGEDVTDLPERDVAIHALRLVDDLGDGDFRLEVHCGSGTYVRRLASDIGESLGTGAYCTALRRTAVGVLSVDDAIAPDEVSLDAAVDPLRALGHMARRDLDPAEAADVLHGRAVPAADAGADGGPVAMVADGRLIAVGAADGGALRPSVVIGSPR
ncbi:tRNA pseudouridine(55) synthase TruB [Miltoncostaea oceani]|uniref:tRNA pseudouridine(55) synthase TruB n=1 Tax=Miltoncostaea oceani TaxID=2843216 RepID=UPI001C3E5766|nr:tRNA pseudouridine(55) synthase TruB [Miltoncostaea oceani]